MLEQIVVSNTLTCNCKAYTNIGDIHFYDECECSLKIDNSVMTLKVDKIEVVSGD